MKIETEMPHLPQETFYTPGFEGAKQTTFKRNKRFSPLMLTGLIATMVIIIGGGVFLVVLPHMALHAAGAQANPNCTLIVPANPLSAQGLATPYQLLATDANAGPCNEANANQSAFVQGVIYDPNSGTFSVYSPLVIDKGTQPAAAPVVPMLPQGSVVGLWFGFNGTSLLLQGTHKGTLGDANCVNGLNKSLFTQFAYCNAPNFFAAANQGFVAHKYKIPALQMAKDGMVCPTVRDFSVIDQDQSDNVQTQYLSTADGRTAQFSAANQAALQGSTPISNPSDNALLTHFLNPVLGCTAWEAPDLANGGQPVAALALDELQASQDQGTPIAQVPLTDPMTTIAQGNNNNPSLEKTNLYRIGVDQIQAANDQQASGTTYCQNFIQTGMPRLILDKPLTIKAGTPDAAAANNLFTFLAQRFQASYNNLNCPQLLKMPNPVTTQTDANGVVTAANFNTQVTTPAPPASNAPNCNINGQAIPNCNGTVAFNGQSCQVSYANKTVTMDCKKQ